MSETGGWKRGGKCFNVTVNSELHSSHNGTAEDSRLLGCYVMLTDKWLLNFQRKLVPSSSLSGILWSHTVNKDTVPLLQQNFITHSHKELDCLTPKILWNVSNCLLTQHNWPEHLKCCHQLLRLYNAGSSWMEYVYGQNTGGMILKEGQITYRKIYPSPIFSNKNSTCTKPMAGKLQGNKPIGRSGFICVDNIEYILRVIGCKNISCWTTVSDEPTRCFLNQTCN